MHRHAGEAVVGGIAQDDEDGRRLLDSSGAVAFVFQLGEGQGLGRVRFPPGQGVRQVDAGAFVALFGERGAQRPHGQADLQVGDDKRRRHDLEAEHPLRRRLLHPFAGQRSLTLAFEIS